MIDSETTARITGISDLRTWVDERAGCDTTEAELAQLVEIIRSMDHPPYSDYRSTAWAEFLDGLPDNLHDLIEAPAAAIQQRGMRR